MALTVAPSAGNQRSLAAVRAWWRVTHPAPSLAQRLDVLYTAAIVIAIFGALAYGTANSALAQVVTAHWLAVFGPSLAMISMLVTAHCGYGPYKPKRCNRGTAKIRPKSPLGWSEARKACV